MVQFEEQAGYMLEIGAEVLHVRRIPALSRHEIPLLEIDISYQGGFDTQ